VKSEIFEEGIFLGREGNLLAGAFDLSGPGVDDQISNFEQRIFVVRLTPDEGPDSRQQLLEMKGLDEVIIGSSFEAGHNLLRCIEGS